MNELDVAAKIWTSTGWLELEDEDGGYSLSAESFATSATSHRKTEISSEWMEGTFVARSVRENITENLAVYVAGDSPFQLAQRLDRLTDALDQLNYPMVVRFADSQQDWSCFVADYTLSTKVEMRFATMALLTATIPRLPFAAKTKVYR